MYLLKMSDVLHGKLQKQLGNPCFWLSCCKKIYVLNYSWHFEQCFHNHQQLWLFRIHLGKTKALTSDLEFSV